MRKPTLIFCLSALAGTAFAETSAPVVFGNSLVRYTISADARNVAFVHQASGADYLRTNVPSPCALARVGGKDRAATAAKLANGRLTLRFGDSDIHVVLKTEAR